MNNLGQFSDWERPARAGWWRRGAAYVAARFHGPYEALVAPMRTKLLSDLEGHVLEIGPGVGANLPFYSSHIAWTGFEPNAEAHRHLTQRAMRYGIRGSLVAAYAEEIPLPDASVDHVVATLVLCSIDVLDLDRVLSEIRRVLKPGGTFRFLEHVAADEGTSLRDRQRFWAPVSRALGDGCSPDRDPLIWIERAGFSFVEASRFDVPAGILSPHLAGTAVR